MAPRSNGASRKDGASRRSSTPPRRSTPSASELVDLVPTHSPTGVTRGLPPFESQALSYVRVLKRRKWAIVQMLLLGPLVALVISLHQTPEYRASSGVLLSLDHTAGVAPSTPVA